MKIDPLSKRFIGFVMLFLGVFTFIYGGFMVWQQNIPVKEASEAVLASENIKKLPARLVIERLSLALPITPANLNNGKWDNPEGKVAYWIDSPLPGELGNSVFYGHNWPVVFGSLNKVKAGDRITVDFTDRSSVDFEVSSVSVVTADQTHILQNTKDARITLYTCTGFLDSKRLVVVAVRKSSV